MPAVVAPGPVVTPGVARYLEVLYYLREEGVPSRPGVVAEWLGVSGPSVSEAVRRLVRDGLAETGPDRAISLTATGESAARDIVRRHRVLERWLDSDLGLDWVSADEEAHALSSAISDVVLERLHERLGRPATCPHGNPIPGVLQTPVGSTNLADLPVGSQALVRRISEMAEHEAPEVLRLLQATGVVPGATVRLVSRPPGSDVLELTTDDGRRVHLASHVARAVWVAGD
jgi:DtxR family Mn-dependent transcriptional regulator